MVGRCDSLPGVLMVAGHFAPENVSGTHRSTHFARALNEAGIPVSVLTIPVEVMEDLDPSLAEVFPHEDRVLRVPMAPTLVDRYLALKRRSRSSHAPPPTTDPASQHPAESRLASPIRTFLRTWSRFPDVFEGWYRPAVQAGLNLARQRPIAAVFASGPPWTGLMVAHTVARRLGVPLVTDFRDPWTTTMGRGYYPPGVWNTIARRRERRIVGDSRTVLFNSPHVMAAAARAYPSDATRPPFQLILNGTDAPRAKTDRPISAAYLPIRHLGTLYFGRDVTPFLEALGNLGPLPAGALVEFDQIGGSDRPLPTHAGPAAVRHRDTIPHAEALDLMARPSVLLVVQPPVFNPQIPTKVFEYLASGNPILVLAEEASAVWQLAKEFPRCRRLDHADQGHNSRVLRDLISGWSAGRVGQSRSVEDTASLTKAAVGIEFASLMAALLGAERAPSQGRTETQCSDDATP